MTDPVDKPYNVGTNLAMCSLILFLIYFKVEQPVVNGMKAAMLDYEKNRTLIDRFNAKVYAVQYTLFYKTWQAFEYTGITYFK